LRGGPGAAGSAGLAILQKKEYEIYFLLQMNRQASPKPRTAPDPGVTLSRATVRAARYLAVAQSDLADVIGVSAATLSRLANGRKALEAGSKPWQLAALFVRLFRSLDAIVGSDDAAARAWLRSDNSALGGVPLTLIHDPAGLVRTVDYLDAARARI
jgi:transcriptional regulator with XRE-family HTH domain